MEPEDSLWSCTQVAMIQALGPSSIVLLDKLAGSWVGSGENGIPVDTQIRNSDVASSGLNYCTMLTFKNYAQISKCFEQK